MPYLLASHQSVPLKDNWIFNMEWKDSLCCYKLNMLSLFNKLGYSRKLFVTEGKVILNFVDMQAYQLSLVFLESHWVFHLSQQFFWMYINRNTLILYFCITTNLNISDCQRSVWNSTLSTFRPVSKYINAILECHVNLSSYTKNPVLILFYGKTAI